jgi:hypothetical protein
LFKGADAKETLPFKFLRNQERKDQVSPTWRLLILLLLLVRSDRLCRSFVVTAHPDVKAVAHYAMMIS